MKHLNFGTVDEEFVKRVKVDAVRKGVPLRTYLKTAVEFYLEHNETTKKQNVVTTRNQHNILKQTPKGFISIISYPFGEVK